MYKWYIHLEVVFLTPIFEVSTNTSVVMDWHAMFWPVFERDVSSLFWCLIFEPVSILGLREGILKELKSVQ